MAFWWDGFDLYGTAANMVLNYESAGSAFLNTDNERTGSSCLYGSITKAYPASIGNLATVWVGSAIKRPDSATMNVFFINDGAEVQIYLHITADGALQVRRGDNVVLHTTAAGTMTVGVYTHVALKVTVHSSTGEIELFVNETSIWSGTSLNTRSPYAANNYSTSITFSGGYHDDIWISDANEGDCKVIEDPPDDDGHYTEFASSGGGANYQNVDDATPNDDTDYNSTGVNGEKDSFQFPALSVTGTVKGVKTLFKVRGDVGSKTFRPFLRIGGTDYNGSSETINTTYAFRGVQVWALNPATSGAWSQAAAEGAEIGIEHIS